MPVVVVVMWGGVGDLLRVTYHGQITAWCEICYLDHPDNDGLRNCGGGGGGGEGKCLLSLVGCSIVDWGGRGGAGTHLGEAAPERPSSLST